MRILYVHNASAIGGGNKVLLTLFEGLDRSRFEPVSVIPEPGPLEPELRRLGVPYAIVDLRPTPRSKLSLAAAIGRFRMVCSRFRVWAVHANDPLCYRAASLGLRGSRVARVCYIHHPLRDPDGLRWMLERPPRIIVTPSRFMKRNLVRWLDGMPRIPIEDIWNPIDLDWFRPADDVARLRESIGLAATRRHVSMVATLMPHKGHPCFLRMASLVLRRVPDTEFHVVGRAQAGQEAYAEDLRREAGELGIADRVRFWGFVEDSLARDLLCASDLFVLPTHREGFGLSIAEAQACRVPVLTSAVEPLDEVVDEGRTGYLIDPEDHAGFAVRAVELLESEDLRRRMAGAGRDWVVGRFSRQVYVDRMQDLYERTVLSRV